MTHNSHKISAIYGALLTAVIAIAPAYAAPTPIPTSLLGTHAIMFDGSSFPFDNLIGAFPGGYGGAFQANIYTSSTGDTGPSVRANVWCVDYQLDVGYGSNYIADITRLSAVTTPTDLQVRYGNLDTSSPSNPAHWANALNPVDSFGYDTNSALYRYALAAILVSQYDNVNSQIQPENPDNDARNQAIQAAIWYATYNTDYNPGATWPGFNTSSGVPAGYTNWVEWAEANVDNVDLNRWAVISGPALSDGTLLDATGGVYQTFLVEVANPEPGFYALVGVGLAGLAVVARKRRTKAGTNIAV